MATYFPLSPNTRLKNNRYVIKSFLAAGGFGAVYVAEDTLMRGQLCVLKESSDQTPDGRAQFEVEAATLSVLNHPNLVRVTDSFVEPNQKMYLVMEYIEGEDLEEMLKRAPGVPPGCKAGRPMATRTDAAQRWQRLGFHPTQCAPGAYGVRWERRI